MSLTSNDPAIKRFTYDWLIRFAELYPFKINDYYMDKDCPDGVYNPYNSKYAAISPLLTKIIAQHMPQIIYTYELKISEGEIQDITLPKWKKCNIFVCDYFKLCGHTPGAISELKKNNVTIYGGVLQMIIYDNFSDVTITPEELRHLLKPRNFHRKVEIRGVLTESITFTEIWPMVAKCESVMIDLHGLVYDENITQVLRKHQTLPEELRLCRFDMTENEVLAFFDFILARQDRPKQLWFKFLNCQPVSLSEAIVKRYESAGIPQDYCFMPEAPFHVFELCEICDHLTGAFVTLTDPN